MKTLRQLSALDLTIYLQVDLSLQSGYFDSWHARCIKRSPLRVFRAERSMKEGGTRLVAAAASVIATKRLA